MCLAGEIAGIMVKYAMMKQTETYTYKFLYLDLQGRDPWKNENLLTLLWHFRDSLILGWCVGGSMSLLLKSRI